jgi:ribosomal protein L33
MSERLTVCIKCGSKNLTTLKVLDPNTTNMNMKAKLKCSDCGKEAVYEVVSNYTRNKRRQGFIKI